MGGVGISNGSVWHLNNQNPAALTSNIFTTFEMGLSSDLRQVSNNKITDLNGSANFDDRIYILKTVDVPADSTVVIEKPINLGAGDKLETQASANGDIDVFASILEMT